MSKILVTGASGNLGRKVLLQLLKMNPPSRLAAFVRDPDKAKDLAALGIEVRQGDYFDPESLKRACKDVEKLMLTSTHAFTDRKTAHANVIKAAVDAGIKHVVYMPIIRKANSNYVLQEVTEEDKFTENLLLSSGLVYTLAKHPPFLDVIGNSIGMNAAETGVLLPGGHGKFAAASSDDLAEAHAVILSEPGHENKIYSLTGDPAITFSDVAKILSEVTGKEVPYSPISDQEFIELKVAQGFPEFVAKFALGWVQGMNNGEWERQSGDLEKLIGHKPQTATEYLRDEYPNVKHPAPKAAKQELSK